MFKENSFEIKKGPNFISEEEAREIVDKIREDSPDAKISITDEYFVVFLDDKEVNIPRWKKIPTSSDGESIDGQTKIMDEIKEVLKENDIEN